MKILLKKDRFPAFIRVLLRFAGLLILLIVLAYGIILIPAVQHTIQKRVVCTLNQYGMIYMRDLSMNWRLYVRAHQIQWSEPAAGRQITCDTLGIQIAPFRLLQREIPVSSVDVRGLSGNGGSVDSFMGKHNKNIPATHRPSRWRLGQCLFQASNVNLSAGRGSTSFNLTGMNVRIHLHHDMNMEGLVKIDTFDLRRDLKTLSLGNISAGFSLLDEPEDSLGFQSKFIELRLKKSNDGLFHGLWIGTGYRTVLSWLNVNTPVRQISGEGILELSFSPFYLKTRNRLFLNSESPLYPDSLQFSGTVFPNGIQSVQLNIPWLEGKAEITGGVSFDSSDVSTLSLAVSVLSLDPLWQGIRNSVSPFQGYFSGHLTGTGPGLLFKYWSGQGSGKLSRLFYQNQPVSDMTAQLDFSPERIGFSAHQLTTEISGQFVRYRSGPSGELRIRNLRTRLLAPWINLSGMQGRLQGTASISGTWAEPLAHGEFWSKQLTYQFLAVDSFYIEGGYRQTQWTIDQARILAHSDSLLNPSRPLKGNLQVAANCAGPLNRLRGGMQIYGHIQRWRRYHADSLNINLSLQDQVITAGSMFQINSLNMKTEGVFHLDSLRGELRGTMTSTGDTLEGRWITLIDTVYGFRFQTGKRLQLSLLSPLMPGLPKGLLFMQGIYQPFKNIPSGELVLEIDRLQLISNNARVSGYINLRNQMARFKTLLVNSSDSINVNGALSGISPGRSPDIQARIDGQPDL